MKKIVNLKEIMIIIISLTIVAISASVLATDAGGLIVTGGQNTSGGTIDANQYRAVQDADNTANDVATNNYNTIGNNSNNNNSNVGNNAKKYNTNNSSELPQTGVEDYNIGILLIICTISAIYAYNKIKQYRNI